MLRLPAAWLTRGNNDKSDPEAPHPHRSKFFKLNPEFASSHVPYWNSSCLQAFQCQNARQIVNPKWTSATFKMERIYYGRPVNYTSVTRLRSLASEK